MPSTYSSNLQLNLIGTGEQSGAWGGTSNFNFGTLVEQAISSYVTQQFTTDADVTLYNGALGTDGGSNNTAGTIYSAGTTSTPVAFRNMYIECTSAVSLTATRNLIVPNYKKLYFVYNNTTGGQAITVKVSGLTGVTIPNGKRMSLVCNGTDIVEALTYSSVIAPANPTASIGLTAVNGVATTYLRSDAAQALDQTISPTWTGTHTFNGTFTGTGVATYLASPPAIGGTAANSGKFTTLSASSTVSGTGFSTYLASPPAIGSTAPSSGAFTTISASSTLSVTGAVSGTGFTNLFAAPPSIGNTTPGTGAFTSLSASSLSVSGTFSAGSLSPTSSSIPVNGFYYPSTNTLGAATNSTNRMTIGSGIQVGTPTGGDMGAGTLNATALYINGTGVSASGMVPANPTAQVGLTAVNGTASTFIRSDGAPALSQAITPTWTGQHTFNNGAVFNSNVGVGSSPSYGTSGQVLTSAGTGAAPTWGTVIAPTTTGTSGQVLTSNATNTPTWAALAPAGVTPDARTTLTLKTVSVGTSSFTIRGSLYLSATTQMLIFNDGATSPAYYAAVYDSSSDTLGSLVVFTPSIVPYTSGVPDFQVRFYVISSTSVLVCYSNLNIAYARILSVSSTTVTANSTTTLTSMTSINSDIVVFGSSYVFAGNSGGYRAVIAMTVSGTTVTSGTPASVSSPGEAGSYGTGALMIPMSGTSGITSFIDNVAYNYNFVGFTISGTTITLGSTTIYGGVYNNGSYPALWGPYFILPSGRVFAFSNGQGYLFLLSLSGTTVTQVATTASYAGSYYVQSGNSILSCSTTGASVYTDSSGTIVSNQTVFSPTYSNLGTIIQGTGATILGLPGTTPNYLMTISIVSNAPSISITPKIYSYSYPPNIQWTVNSSAASKNMINNGSNYTGVCLGASGYYYRSNASNPYAVFSGMTISGNATYFLNNGYSSATTPAMDPTNAANAWYLIPYGNNTFALQRVQYA